MPRPPVLVGDFRPESACVWHTAISAGPPPPANPAILWHVPLVRPSGGWPLGCLLEYSPRAWVGRRMCVTHIRGLAGAAQVGPPPNLVRTGMFNGHPRHVWVAVLGPFVWDASCGPQRCHAGVRRCAHRPPPVCAAGAAPPHTRDLGVTYCRARTMEAQEAPGGSNRRELGWFCRRHFDRPGPIYL